MTKTITPAILRSLREIADGKSPSNHQTAYRAEHRGLVACDTSAGWPNYRYSLTDAGRTALEQNASRKSASTPTYGR